MFTILGVFASFYIYNLVSCAVVDIDLLASSFIPGKPNYERVKQALQSHLPLVMDFALVAGT